MHNICTRGSRSNTTIYISVYIYILYTSSKSNRTTFAENKKPRCIRKRNRLVTAEAQTMVYDNIYYTYIKLASHVHIYII